MMIEVFTIASAILASPDPCICHLLDRARSYGATLLSFGPFSALYLMFYERLRAMAVERRRANAEPNPEVSYG